MYGLEAIARPPEAAGAPQLSFAPDLNPQIPNSVEDHGPKCITVYCGAYSYDSHDSHGSMNCPWPLLASALAK